MEQLGRELAAKHGIRYWVIAADLAVPDAPATIVERIPAEARPVTALVNNAGFGTSGPFARSDLRTDLELLQVNIVSLTALTKLLLPQMLAARNGRILNVASTAAYQPGPFMAVYYASKAYVLSFSEAIAVELRGSGVTVTALCPGPVRTEFQARAGVSDVPGSSGALAMDAEPVALAGYRGMQRGARVVIPGVLNRLGALGSQLAPRAVVLQAVRRLMARRSR